jgi:hypothetical protein
MAIELPDLVGYTRAVVVDEDDLPVGIIARMPGDMDLVHGQGPPEDASCSCCVSCSPRWGKPSLMARRSRRRRISDGLTAEARLAIYRHHVFITLTAALQTTYPVLCRLVHERFFGYAADQYIRATRRPGLACSSTEARSQHSSPASSPAGICSTCPTWRGSNGR